MLFCWDGLVENFSLINFKHFHIAQTGLKVLLRTSAVSNCKIIYEPGAFFKEIFLKQTIGKILGIIRGKRTTFYEIHILNNLPARYIYGDSGVQLEYIGPILP